MATYYVRTDGNNANAGTGPATNQAWQTIAKALGASGIASGDTVYIAPGSYNESITIGMTSATVTTSIIGDPTASQFSGISAGPVTLTAYTSAGAVSSTVLLTATTKNYLSFQNIYFDGGTVTFTTSTNTTFSNCQFDMGYVSAPPFIGFLNLTSPSATALNLTVNKCVFFGGESILVISGGNVADSTSITNSIFMNSRLGIANTNIQMNVFNCSFIGIRGSAAIANSGGSASFLSTVTNCLIWGCLYGIYSDTGNRVTQTYNRFIGNATNLTSVATSATSTTTFSHGLILPYYLQNNLGTFQMFSSIFGGPNTAAGTSTGAPASDMYGVTWTGATPDTGSATYRNLSNVTPYVPTERNASTITIAPGSTSQSIELYLGATGLTFATSGLSAYYVRNRSAPVAITLVTQTATGSWASGGFAEISSSFTPGVYRLDVPDAAFAAGADDVTVVVRGASGTNGAVMTIKLSSGGLTAAQTAQAVLDATASTHNNIGSIGASIQDKAGYSLSTPQSFSTTGSVGSVTGNVAGNVTGTVGGVAGNVTGNIAGSVATVASPDNIIDGVWDEQRVGHTASGSFGEKLQTNALADEMLARDLGSGLNAGTAEERTVRSALRAIRNKVNVGSSQMVVKKEDDTTDAWTASVTTTAVSSNVSGIDPN